VPPEPERSELARRLDRRREELLRLPGDVPAQVTAALDELSLTYEHPLAEMWFVQVGKKAWATLGWIEDVAMLSMILMYERQPDPPLKLLIQNGDGGISWSSVTNDDDGSEVVATRVALPMDGFDRQSLLLGLEPLARETRRRKKKPSDVELLLGERRDPPGDDPPEQWSDRAEAGLHACFAELGLEAAPKGRPGRWLVQSDVGPLLLTLHHNGEALVIAHQLEHAWDAEDDRIGWWMLQTSDGAARIGLSGADDDGWVVSAIVALSALPLTAQALAWGIARCLELGESYLVLRQGWRSAEPGPL
jgi:hypothetical protein